VALSPASRIAHPRADVVLVNVNIGSMNVGCLPVLVAQANHCGGIPPPADDVKYKPLAGGILAANRTPGIVQVAVGAQLDNHFVPGAVEPFILEMHQRALPDTIVILRGDSADLAEKLRRALFRLGGVEASSEAGQGAEVQNEVLQSGQLAVDTGRPRLSNGAPHDGHLNFIDSSVVGPVNAPHVRLTGAALPYRAALCVHVISAANRQEANLPFGAVRRGRRSMS
jgi:hypothetical protein